MAQCVDQTVPGVGIAGSKALYSDWDSLKHERTGMDDKIIRWSDDVDPAWLASEHTWFSNAAQREVEELRKLYRDRELEIDKLVAKQRLDAGKAAKSPKEFGIERP